MQSSDVRSAQRRSSSNPFVSSRVMPVLLPQSLVSRVLIVESHTFRGKVAKKAGGPINLTVSHAQKQTKLQGAKVTLRK